MLNDLKYPKGARTNRKRKGQGPGTGNGKTAGRGHKGQKARRAVTSAVASRAVRCRSALGGAALRTSFAPSIRWSILAI